MRYQIMRSACDCTMWVDNLVKMSWTCKCEEKEVIKKITVKKDFDVDKALQVLIELGLITEEEE